MTGNCYSENWSAAGLNPLSCTAIRVRSASGNSLNSPRVRLRFRAYHLSWSLYNPYTEMTGHRMS